MNSCLQGSWRVSSSQMKLLLQPLGCAVAPPPCTSVQYKLSRSCLCSDWPGIHLEVVQKHSCAGSFCNFLPLASQTHYCASHPNHNHMRPGAALEFSHWQKHINCAELPTDWMVGPSCGCDPSVNEPLLSSTCRVYWNRLRTVCVSYTFLPESHLGVCKAFFISRDVLDFVLHSPLRYSVSACRVVHRSISSMFLLFVHALFLRF